MSAAKKPRLSRFDQKPADNLIPPFEEKRFPENLANVSTPPDIPIAESGTPKNPPRQTIVGKRKMGGRVLKTGLLTADKLAKPEGPSSEQSLSKFKGAHGISPASAGDASSVYLEEMKKYSEHLCAEERHARPLVK